jgi:uracil phosphoribosyltransferase
MLMGYELTRNFPLETITIETPVSKTSAKMVSGKKVAVVAILRAGLGMVDGLLSLVPVAKVGHIGLNRVEGSPESEVYCCKMPQDIEDRMVILVDSMLATGGSASAAISLLKDQYHCHNIRLMCLVAAPEGVAKLQNDHPDVDIFTAALDDGLDANRNIVPGLGDAGDRMFGTK